MNSDNARSQRLDLRQARLETIRETPSLIAAALLQTQSGYLIAYLLLCSRWLVLPAVLDLLCAGVRLIFWFRHRNRSAGSSWFDNINIAVTTFWIGLVSILALTLLRTPSVRGVTLGVALALGFSGYVTARFAAFPKIALSMLVLLNTATGIGLLTSSFPELHLIGYLAPGGSITFGTIVIHAHKSLMEAIRAKEENRRLSRHDPLTDLPNRLLMRERLDVMCSDCSTKPAAGAFAVLCLDLDGFKQVNDRYGHAAGDQVLIRVAQLVSAELTGSELLCRVGGDEFVIIAPYVDRRMIMRLSEKLIAALASPFSLAQGINARVGVTIGIALCPENGSSPDNLLFRADDALYEAKRAGKGRCLFALPASSVVSNCDDAGSAQSCPAPASAPASIFADLVH